MTSSTKLEVHNLQHSGQCGPSNGHS